MRRIIFEFEQLKKIYYFGKEIRLTDLFLLIKSAKLKHFNKNDTLVSSGSLSKELFFIRKGLVRLYLVKESGEEITLGFRSENQIIANYDSILFKEPSRAYLQTIEPTTTLSIDYDLLFEIISNSPALMKNYRLIYEELLKTTILRLESFVLYTAEERYYNFVKNNPILAERIQDNYLANYLGITPVSLSRIKKRNLS